MFRFVFLATFAGLALSMGLRFPDTDLLSARYFDFKELCKWFCSDDHDYDYWFRTGDETIQPRIFCGLCDKKFNTTTTRPTTPTTTISTTTKNSTRITSTTSSPTSSGGPTMSSASSQGPTMPPTMSASSTTISPPPSNSTNTSMILRT